MAEGSFVSFAFLWRGVIGPVSPGVTGGRKGKGGIVGREAR